MPASETTDDSTRDIDVHVEASEPVRPHLAERWLGRSVAFRAVRVSRAGVTLQEVEVAVPKTRGSEVMARVPWAETTTGLGFRSYGSLSDLHHTTEVTLLSLSKKARISWVAAGEV